MSAAEESQAWRTWQQQVMQQRMAAAAVREQIEDERQEQERRARIEAKRDHDVEAFRASMTGEPPRTLASILHDMSQVRDRAWWDPEAPEGSERNPVRLDQPGAQRSRPVVSDDERTLARARAVDAEFRRHEARYHEQKLREISR